MPSAIHEALVHLFQSRPALAAVLLRDVLGVELPPYEAVRSDSNTFSELKPPEYRADAVTLFDGPGSKPVLTCIVEVQLAIKESKRRDWLAYAATASRQLARDACVLVVTPSAHVARWAERPLAFGYSSVFRPLVLGPRQIPAVTDPEQARGEPFLAVLSAVAHGRGDPKLAVPVAAAASQAVRPLDEEGVYFDLIMACLGEAARKAFQMSLRNYQYQYPPMRESYNKGKLDGRAEGRADDILEVLDARGIPVTDEQRRRIRACTDLETLKQWVRRAATVAATDELFV